MIQGKWTIAMNRIARIIALSTDADIYAVVDEKGNSMGTGSREVCEFLAQMASGEKMADLTLRQPSVAISSNNIGSAITI